MFQQIFSMIFTLNLIVINLVQVVALVDLYDFDFLMFDVLTPLSAIFQLYHGDQF
jgi:hypothetical protein